MEYLEDYEDDRTEEIIRYTWNKARYTLKKDKRVKPVPRNEVQVQIDNDTFQYGHEYVGLNPIFQVPHLRTLKLCRHSKQFSSVLLSFFPFQNLLKGGLTSETFIFYIYPSSPM